VLQAAESPPTTHASSPLRGPETPRVTTRHHPHRLERRRLPAAGATAGAAPTASSAATEPQPHVGPRRSHRGGLDHARDSAPRRHAPTPTDGGARPARAVQSGSGRSRRAGRRIQTPLEAQVQAKATSQPPDSVRISSATFDVETVENRRLWSRRRTPGVQAALPGDSTTPGAPWDHSNGGRADGSSERARISAALPTSVSTSPFVGRRHACEALN
jgi:hypothetical protein